VGKNDIEEALLRLDILTNQLPTALDETYERALQGIPKEKRKHAHLLFQCLVIAFRPLC
jgi:hypothetical protein